MKSIQPQRRLYQDDRAPEWAALYLQGNNLREIGELYELTRERVRQVLADYGITRADGGQSVSSARNKAEKEEKRDQYWIKKAGLTTKQYLAIPSVARSAYTFQRRSFHKVWELNLEQWWDIWTRSGKWSQRGLGRDRYVMARVRPEGPFSVNNVCICTLSEAARLAKLLGK